MNVFSPEKTATRKARTRRSSPASPGPPDLPPSPPADRTEKTSYYLTAADFSHLEGIRAWCRARDLRVSDLPILRSLVVDVRQEEREKFLRNIRRYRRKIYVHEETKIPFERFMKGVRAVESRKENIAYRDSVLEILNMRKVHHGPLGKFTGKGQTICVIDSGIYPNHPDFLGRDGKSRLKWFVDFVEGKEGLEYANDLWGHGTHMSGDAVGNGNASGGIFTRLAPDANLVVLKVEKDIHALQAIHWVLTNRERFGINIVSLSFGVPATQSYRRDPLARAADALIGQGIFVTAAAGNDFVEGSINTPGIHPSVITATALDTHGQTDPARFTIAVSASGGPPPFDRDVPKPNLAFPGVGIYGPLAPGSKFDPQEAALTPFGKYVALSGTSPACQMAAGIVACINQALKEQGLSLSPREMLAALEETASPLSDRTTGKPITSTRQGAGVPNGYEALKTALQKARANIRNKPAA